MRSRELRSVPGAPIGSRSPGHPSEAVEPCASPTGLDWLDPRWRSQIENTTMEATARNSDCQFCTVRLQKSEDPAYWRTLAEPGSRGVSPLRRSD